MKIPEWLQWMLIAVFSLAGVQLIDGTRTFRNDWLVWIMIVGMLLIPIFLDLKEAHLEHKNARDALRPVLDSNHGDNSARQSPQEGGQHE